MPIVIEVFADDEHQPQVSQALAEAEIYLLLNNKLYILELSTGNGTVKVRWSTDPGCDGDPTKEAA